MEGTTTGYESASFKVGEVPMDKIRLGKYSLRDVDRNTEDFQRLRDSIAATDGPMLAIVVREIDDPENPGQTAYGLIDGLQRFSCCQDLGFSKIPARVIDMEDADVAAAQIIANHSRIETKPVEYTKQLHRMLNSSPTMTLDELANQLHVSNKWLSDRLSLAKLHEKIGKLVDEGAIPLGHAFALAKLQPAEEQIQFLETAQTMGIQEFSGTVQNHIKAVRNAARTGRDHHDGEFVPVPHMRPVKEIKLQLETPTAAEIVCTKAAAKTPIEGFTAAIQWVLNMDPDRVEQLKQEFVDRKRAESERRAKQVAERAEQRAAEARKKAAEVEAEVAAGK